VAGGVVSAAVWRWLSLGAGCCHLEEVVAAVRGWRSGQRRRLEGVELGAGCCHLEEVVAAVRGWRSGQPAAAGGG